MEIPSQAETMDDLGEHLSFRSQRQRGAVSGCSIICVRYWAHLKSTGSSCARVALWRCTHKKLPAHQERPGSMSWIPEAQ